MTTLPPQPPPAGYAPAQPSRLSKSSVTSFIFGLLFCIPFGGVVAILMGIIGFIRTSAANVRGRWMAIVGGLLGLANVVLWAVGFTAIIGLIAVSVGLAKAPIDAAHDFIRDLAAGDEPAVHARLAPGFNEADLAKVEEFVRDQGSFVDTNFNKYDWENTKVHLEGTAKFSKAELGVKVDLIDQDDKWKIEEISFHK